MSWPKKSRERVVAEIKSGLKTVKAIAEESHCSEGWVYKIMGEEGYSKQFITREEWKYIQDWRKNRARLATSLGGITALVGPDSDTPEKARRAS